MRKPASMSCALMLVGLLAVPASGAGRLVSEFRITILSTMVTELRGVGEWGFSALVEVGDNRLLFDTGARPGTVLQNVQELAVDLLGIDNVVLSHHHWDHTGGLVALRRALRTQRHRALGQVHAGAGILLPRSPAPFHVSIPKGTGPRS